MRRPLFPTALHRTIGRMKFPWRRKRRAIGRQVTRVARVVHWTVRIALILLLADLFYLMLTWPDWKSLAAGPVPKSSFIRDYELRRSADRTLPPLQWHPVPLSVIPKHLIRAAILGEDARFYEHSGFDLIAFKEAMNYNLAEGRLALGASTISQQTVKNLFLTPARNPLRKWHELVLTWGMERNLSKRRILELYLNIAEFGTGIYGVQAAAQTYFGTAAEALTVEQASRLAATLPGPEQHNPATRTSFFEHRTRKIFNLLIRYPGNAADVINREVDPAILEAPDSASADLHS
ncbi:MAG: monofunctional biosynthetic peptidoglycan transglycosylase [Sulfurifustis sp.]